jgi:hypothetical protein
MGVAPCRAGDTVEIMTTYPVLPERHRDRLAGASMVVSVIPRAIAWTIGAIIGSIVAGFVQGSGDRARV